MGDAADDIEIPAITIADDWFADEVETLDECDDAFSYLTAAIANIEHQIEVRLEDGRSVAEQKRALRYKKAAMQIVSHRRSRIVRTAERTAQERYERVLLDLITSEVSSDQMRA